ncbi:hypothetical protein RRF57_000327 [Xylaria bambusicola]|uniref:Uncharacterized protein n=1 Tax=Xylaria bambusicola TaxID=326684 RepID=A0AAN7UCN2_9PEZI
MDWVQLERSSAHKIMVTKCIVIPDCCNNVERASHCHIHRFVPPRAQRSHNNSCFVQAFLVFIHKNNIRIARPVWIACLDLLGFNNLDSENVFRWSPDLSFRPVHFLQDRGARIDIHGSLELIQFLHGPFDVVQFDQRL